MKNTKRIISSMFLTMTLCLSIYKPIDAAGVTGQVVGRNVVTNREINSNGFKMEVSLQGGQFIESLTEENKNSVIDGLEFDLDDGFIGDGIRGNIERLQGINQKNRSYVVLVGQDEEGNTINTIDRFLSFDKTIPAELKKNGVVEINNRGNLEISCNSQFFRNFSNLISYTNGGVPLGWGDLPISLNIPSEIIKDSNYDVKTNNSYDILEMKAEVELLAYDSEQAYKSKDESQTHRVSKITEEDIRKGGKLIKVLGKARNGPNKWSVDSKLNPLFIKNSFRTDKNFIQGHTDYSQWEKIEDALGSNLTAGNPSLKLWRNYWITAIKSKGESEENTYSPSEMWYTMELPVIEDFYIEEDLNVYINLIAGMAGGSGKSGKEGDPFWGQDGRLSFTISNLDEPIKDNLPTGDYEIWSNNTNTRNIELDKEWKIRFNKTIDYSTIKDNVFIYNKQTQRKFKIEPKLSSDEKTIILSHDNKSFESKQIYIMYINKNIKDKIDGKTLKRGIKMEFTTQ